MKVRITITLDVDAEAWAHEYGLDRRDVREDVKDYVGHHVFGSRHVDDGTFTKVEWR
ncbi:hypothetical protein [Streptomyces violascens]|uniref:hypothetical protein n=1 Tax=Streptomyces violascens TaxID=67381 RepID=UPI0036553B5C